jgi:hypothetical protein
MQLKKDLPKGLPHYFNVDIQFRGQIIPVICSEVRSPDGSASNRLKIEINDYTPGLLAILLAG